jgi:hypothetical protein
MLQSCAPYKIETEAFLTEGSSTNKKAALNHWLYRVIPRHRAQVRWYDLGHWSSWLLFGNDDDGLFGEELTADYRPTQPADGYKALCWGMRNPLHNFTYYVIGTAYWPNSEFALIKAEVESLSLFSYKSEEGCNFAGEGTSLFLGFHGWKPYASLRLRYNENNRSDFYLGWRNRGNFGLKCHLLKKSK